MRKLLLSFLFLLAISLYAQTNRPKLVIGIVVDQMRHDYLQRFESKFTDSGFKRMINEGFEARNNHYNYIPTYTGPGHASIYTGTTPRFHGIIANDWYSRALDDDMYCAGNPTATNIGGSPAAGKISPENLLANTITDELKLSTNFRSKVIGISIKDRGAVLPAGHIPDGAYWYDSGTGEFMTSDFYMDQLPSWVDKFNKRKLVDKYSDQVWSTLLPIEEYTESTPDNSPYEGVFKGKETPTFPYDLKALREENGTYRVVLSTPFGNSLIAELAKVAIEGEKLGMGENTDFLAVSFSSTDYVGHKFGPNSIEVEDTYIRLDRDLSDLFKYLDNKVGEGNYIAFLTADHGAVEVPSFLSDHNLPGGFFNGESFVAKMQKYLIDSLGKGEWILDVSNNQVFLNRPLIQESGKNLREIQNYIAEYIMDFGPVLETFTASDLSRTDYTDLIRKSVQNGFNRKLSGDVLIVLKPGYLPGSENSTGTSHGSGYNYDTHVPFLIFGQGIKHGFTVRRTTISDIAPTLAMLLNISIPNAAVTGDPIIELFK